jgi:hypothetical protein
LTLVALDGAETTLDGDALAELLSIEYTSGHMTSVGTIKAVNTYTGVKLTTLCDLIGDINNETSGPKTLKVN